MTNVLDLNSILLIVVSRWIPVILTVFGGGYAASILFPKLQQRIQQAKQLSEKRIEIAEEIVCKFNRYIVSWQRLIQISNFEESRELSDAEKSRKLEFVSQRNERRDDLLDSLSLCELYFSTETCSITRDFRKWDEDQGTKRLCDLPPILEWRNREAEIVKKIKNEITLDN